jgi:hypothetical protein
MIDIKKRNKDMQDRKRQDKQDIFFVYPAYPAACDPAYPCSSLFSNDYICTRENL